MNFIYTRNSDAALDVFLKAKNDFENLLKKYGYDGVKHPQKQWISTETDLPQKTIGDAWGSLDSANNYIMKVNILAQANGILQVYKYGLGENSPNTTDSFNTMGLYGDISGANTTIDNAQKTDQFKVYQTVSSLLYGKVYDEQKTSKLNLSDDVRGAAFKDSNNIYTYVLWAKTKTDQTESTTIKYTFPFNFSGTRREWDFSNTNQKTSANNIVWLTGSPSFFTENVSNPATNFEKVSTTVKMLNVRDGANGKVVMQTPFGSKGVIIENSFANGITWKKVVFDTGVIGWVSGKYLRRN